MKTYKFFLILCTVIFFFSCTPDKSVFILEGEMPEQYAGYTIFLVDDDGSAAESLDVMDGKFLWENTPDTTAFYFLYLYQEEEQSNEGDSSRNINNKKEELPLYIMSIIPERGKVKVNLINPEKSKLTPLNKELMKYTAEKKNFIDLDSLNRTYLERNKDNAVGKFILLSWLESMSVDQMEALISELTEGSVNRKLLEEKIISAKISEKTSVGKMFLDFTIENGNPDSSVASLSDYVGKGKYVLVDFWASWCGPCIQETPIIAEVYNKYKGDKFEVLGVAVWEEKRENTWAAIKEHGIIWPQILDAKSFPTELYNIKGIPHIILFGPDGTILARGLRGESLKNKIGEVMHQ